MSDNTSYNSYVPIFGKRIHKAWIILLSCCILQATTLAMVMGCTGNYWIPICEEIGCSRAEISGFITAYFLSMIPALPICGKLLTKYNSRVVICVSVIAVALGEGAMSFYTAPWMWYVSGVIMGTFGCCVFMVPLATMVSTWFHKRAGVAMGLATAASALAQALFSPIIQQIIATFGWRTAYLFEAAIILIITLPCAFFLVKLEPKDWNAHPYGLNTAEAERLKEEYDVDFSEYPGVTLNKALKSVPFWALFVFAGIAAIIGSGFDSHLPGYANTLGYGPTFGALMVSALALGSFCEKLIVGWINDKWGVWVGVTIEIIFVCIGLFGMVVVRNQYGLLAVSFLFGIQDSLTNVSLPLLVRRIFGTRDYTEIYSWARMGAGIFGAFAAVLVGLSFDMTGSFVPAFFIAAVLALLGGVLVFIAKKTAGSLEWEDSENTIDAPVPEVES